MWQATHFAGERMACAPTLFTMGWHPGQAWSPGNARVWPRTTGLPSRCTKWQELQVTPFAIVGRLLSVNTAG
jgi:hypothetical protein